MSILMTLIVGLIVGALAKCRHAQGGDIADSVRIESRMRRLERPLGSRRAGLPHLEMDYGLARRFLLGGGGHHVHDDEGIDAGRATRELACHVAVY